MSNLIPEKRINKNGVAVTKHVRADTSARTSAAIPSPASVPGMRRASTPLLDANLGLAHDSRKTQGKEPLAFTLDDLDPEAVEQIERLLQADYNMRPRSYVIHSGVNAAVSMDTLEQCVARMHNVAIFGEITAGPDDNSITGYLSGLEHYGEAVLQQGQDYVLDVPQEQVEKVANLIDFTIKANKKLGETIVYDSFMDTFNDESGVTDFFIKLRDDELAAYILEYPEHSDGILDMLEKEEELLPVQLMHDRLTHDVQAIRDGVL